MIQEIHQSLEQLKANLKEIESAKSDYKLVGQKTIKMLTQSEQLIRKHDNVLSKLRAASVTMDVSQSDLIKGFQTALSNSSNDIFESYKKSINQAQIDFNTQSSNLSDKLKVSSDAYIKVSDKILLDVKKVSKNLAKTQDDISLKVADELKRTQEKIIAEHTELVEELNEAFNIKTTNLLKAIEIYYTTSFDTTNTSIKNNITKSSELYKKIEASSLSMNKDFNNHIARQQQVLIKFKNEIQEHLKVYNNLVLSTNQLVAIIKDVNFPQRLDKLDSTISGINLGIQNTQNKILQLDNKLNKTEENILYGNKRIEEYAQKSFDAMSNQINQINNQSTQRYKKMDSFLIVIIIIQFISLIALGILFFKG